LALGHDEEVGGLGGARMVARALAKERFALVLDEGGVVTYGVLKGIRCPVALIGVQEKGFLSMRFDLDDHTLSGHSSLPPADTVISVLASAVHDVLRDAPSSPALREVAQRMLTTLASDQASLLQRFVFAASALPGVSHVMARVMSLDPVTRPTVQTTCVPTIINAGNKDNVLPRKGFLIVNCRIIPGDTRDALETRMRAALRDSDPSAVASVTGAGYALLADVVGDFCPECAVAPYLVSGATDSRHFENMTDSVLRFAPLRMTATDLQRFHGTDERVHRRDVENAVAFYMRMMRRAGEAAWHQASRDVKADEL
jgi:carboxypeptidase PM20D1